MAKTNVLKQLSRYINRRGICIIDIPHFNTSIVSIRVYDRKRKLRTYSYRYSHLQLLLDFIATLRIRHLTINYNGEGTVTIQLPEFTHSIEEMSLYNVSVPNLDSVLSMQTDISVLDLSNVKGTLYTDTIQSMTKLSRLELDGISIDGPLDLHDRTILDTVIVSDCKMDTIRMSGCSRLKCLFIDTPLNCTLESLDLVDCISLQYLSIDGCTVSGPVPSWITSLRSLKTLELTNCSIQSDISIDLLQHLIYPNGSDSRSIDTRISCSEPIDEESIVYKLQYVYHEDRATIEIRETDLYVYPEESDSSLDY